jgi:MtN3 and saliva related transmembrane protein
LEPITIIGACAAVASTVSFVPQAWKIIKSRRTSDISAAMYAVTVIGFALWTAYGVMLAQWPLIFTNAICLVLSAFILAMKLLPRRQKNAIADALDPEAAPKS